MRLYRALLHLYPSAFQIEYGDEMSAIFDRRRRDTSNVFGAVALWIETLFDVVFNAVQVHWDILWQDLRYAARTLSKAWGFTLTAIVVAALGIGANTAAFTMVDHVLLRPFPFADQDRLVKLYEDNSLTASRGSRNDVAPANYRDWKQMSTSFEAMGMFRGLSVNLVGQGEPQQIAGASVSGDMFPVLGVKPVLGRVFEAEDDRETAPATMVLSFGLWQGLFGGDASIVGRKVILDDAPYTVIGVMPRNFYFPNRDAQLWTALRFEPRVYDDRTNTFVFGIARLKRGVSIEKAQTEMRMISGQLQTAYPKELAHVGAAVVALHDDISSQSRLLLTALLGAALCVLLIACTNLANLLLARALMRRKELAVRAAMGAGRERLVRQMLTESVGLAFIGGALGVLLAYLAIPLLVRLVPVSLPIAEVPSIDLRVLLFAALFTCATGIGFGVVPALRISRDRDTSGLREGSRSGGGRRERLRSILVIAEVAGCVVLLVSSGLLIRALWRIQAVNPGFRAENVLTLQTSLPMPKYEELKTREPFYTHVLSEASRLPGVTGAAYISFLPVVHGGGIWPVEVEGHPEDYALRQTASLRFVSPGFFSVMGIPVLMGRDVGGLDTPNSLFVAVVSDSFVRKYWPGENPLGRRFDFGNHQRTIVGVVGDIRVRGLERSSEPQVYMPYRQHNENVSTWYAPKDLVVRASGNTAALAPALRRIIREADPQQPISSVRMFADIIEAETAPRQVQASVLGAFALVAFLLAAIGIHGLLSFAVSNRTQEIGVRIALGAQRSDILGMVMRDGIVLAAIGIIVGVAFAYGAGRQLQSLLAGVHPGDAPTFLSAVVFCLVMTMAGSLIPALRAVRVDPTTAIRTE